MTKEKTLAEKIANKVINDDEAVETVETSVEDTEKISDTPSEEPSFESNAPSSIQTVSSMNGPGKHPVRHETMNNRGFGYNP